MPRFYSPIPLVCGAEIDLPEGAVRHVQVLRLQPGDAITLFDGAAQGLGGEFEAIVLHMGRNSVRVRIDAHLALEREAARAVHLLAGITAGERMDWLVEKATELGVASITPVAAERSVLKLKGERADKKRAHWQAVAVAACEQCGRNQVPLVAPLEKLENWLARPAEASLRLLLAPDAAVSLHAIPRQASIQLLIGAEGGLDPQEIIAATQVGFQAVRLGPRVLRTETAGLAALAAMQCLWGDFCEGEDHV